MTERDTPEHYQVTQSNDHLLQPKLKTLSKIKLNKNNTLKRQKSDYREATIKKIPINL